jgi:hypothetical protein
MGDNKAKESIVRTVFINFLLEELEKKGIDITKDDYNQKSAFKDLEHEFVMDEGILISKAWCIEKNIVGQERLKKIYGKYTLGVKYSFSALELNDSIWIRDLVDTLDNDEWDEFAIERYFYREKGSGLVHRLQKLGIDLQRFSNDGEKVKLLFFLCCFEKQRRIEMTPFLSNPTLENVDNGFVGSITRNGELISEIKMNIQKEITNRYIIDSKEKLKNIALQWQNVIEQILYKLDLDVGGWNKKELEQIDLQLQFIQSMFLSNKIIQYKDTILETFYLKILQHENLGRENDIIDIQELDRQGMYDPDASWVNQYKEMLNQVVDEEKIEEFIKGNRKRLAYMAFRKNPSSNDSRKFKAASNKIRFYLGMLEDNTLWKKEDGIPVLIIISCIQEIIELNKKEKVNNQFYRYKTKDLKTLNTELYRGKGAYQKNQIAWVEKVRNRYNSNLGKGDRARVTYKIITHLDNLMIKIYQSDSLEDMQTLHSYLLTLVYVIVNDNELIERKFSWFSSIAFKESIGYKVIADNQIKLFFIGLLGQMPYFNNLAEQVGHFIKTVEKEGRMGEKYWPFEITTIPYLDRLEGHLYFTVDPIQKFLVLRKLKLTSSENIRLILYSAGYSVGFCLE